MKDKRKIKNKEKVLLNVVRRLSLRTINNNHINFLNKDINNQLWDNEKKKEKKVEHSPIKQVSPQASEFKNSNEKQYLNLLNNINNQLKVNKNWKGHVAQGTEPLSGVRGDVGSSLLRKQDAHRHFETKENSNKDKKEKQAYSLDKSSVWRTGISHEFESVAESNQDPQLNNHNNTNYLKLSISENKKCYKNVWKKFENVSFEDEILTLNATSGKKEWQLPMERQEFNYDKEMYNILLEDGSNLLVSEKHKVYVGVEEDDKKIYYNSNSFNKSLVENILISDCLLNASSSDHIGVLLSANDKAKYGSSFVSCLPCGDILLASERNLEYFSSSDTSKSLFSSEKTSLNSDSVIFAECMISDLLLNNSSNTNSGDIRLQPLSSNFLNTSLLVDEELKNEKSIDASTINSGGIIFYKPCLLATLRFNSSASLSANSSVILLFFNISSNLSNLFALSNLSTNSSLTTSDQITQTNLDNLAFNLSSSANVMLAIYNFPLDFNFSTFSSSLTFSIITLRATSATFTSGNSFLNSANNLSGTDTVILYVFDILDSPSIYFNTSNYFNVYKPSDSEKKDIDLNSFKLQPITETYELINNGKEIYFLDENKPIKVKNITKENYKGIEPITSQLNERQKKALSYVINKKLIKGLEKINKISNATAKRDLNELVKKRVFESKDRGGRVCYILYYKDSKTTQEIEDKNQKGEIK